MRADVAVVGAGSFGAWTAWHLHRAGRRVLLLDAYGPANSRASSGGESRIIRLGYGPREIYTRYTIQSMPYWHGLAERNDLGLFHRCGALWIAPAGDAFGLASLAVLDRCGCIFERLDEEQLQQRFPQFRFASGCWGIFEPESGGLMARAAIQSLVGELVREGVVYQQRAVTAADPIDADQIVYACGPWLPKLFPELLGRRITPTRQSVLFFGTPAGDDSFGPGKMPCWVDTGSKFYGLPDLERRGFKIANDRRGVPIDPDTEERQVPQCDVERARQFLRESVPALANAPLIETRVCQYENTSDGDYLIDRHPGNPRVWLAGGGSGHGFKHGPAVGEYLSNLILGKGVTEPKFALANKAEGTAASSL